MTNKCVCGHLNHITNDLFWLLITEIWQDFESEDDWEMSLQPEI